jgi:hypothetical protein
MGFSFRSATVPQAIGALQNEAPDAVFKDHDIEVD